MLRRFRFALRPGWLALHIVVIAVVVTMIVLGRWQLTVSEQKHFSIQNFGYALQWWTFSLFALVLWARIMRDAARGAARGSPARQAPPPPVEDAVPYRRYVMPSATAASSDQVYVAYNDYLAQLAARDEQQEREQRNE